MNKLKIFYALVIIVGITFLGATAYASNKKMNVVAETNDGSWVQSFTDNGNRCYVIERATPRDLITNGTPSNSVAISCVKGDR